MEKGKLIVIEGGDGAGKGTQLALLQEYCREQKTAVSTFDFPQYEKTFFGKWIGRFMKGDFGDVKDVPPYVATIPYAADRWQAKPAIEKALKQGDLVVMNRYVTSNAVYQSAKLPEEMRDEYVDWDFQLEYKEFGVPKEDLVLYLYVPVAISQELIEKKGDRSHLGGRKKDINESNVPFLTEVEKVYLDFLSKYPHWVKIDCVKNGLLLPKEAIHEKIIAVLKSKKILE